MLLIGDGRIGKFGERHWITADREGDDEPQRQHAKRDDQSREESGGFICSSLERQVVAL